MNPYLDVLREQAILILRLNRPEKKNAITADMYTTLASMLEDASRDSGLRAIVLTGVGDAFTSGNDLQDFLANPPESDDAPVLRFLRALVATEKPLLAAVNGAAIGIGTTLLLHCDLVYAAPNAKFQLPFVRLGLVPEAASTLLLPQLMGHRRAAAMLLLSETLNADQAVDAGLINAIVPADALFKTTMDKAMALTALPPAALRLTKNLMRTQHSEAILDTMAREAKHFAKQLKSAEAKEALQAFLEHRPADFSRFN